jgi:hypothetical protein
MSLSSHRHRSAVRSPILGIIGLVLLTAGVIAIANNALACPNCNCYFSSDCASGQRCNHSSGCRVWYASGKKVDGTCTASTSSTSFDRATSPIAAQALDLWLQAYELAALRGGEPDAGLIAKARSLPLTPEQHRAIRQIAIDSEVTLFGMASESDSDSDEEHGRFNLPAVDVDVDVCPVDEEPVDPAEPGNPIDQTTPANGSLLPVDPADAAVGRIVREAMVAEMRSPYHSDFAKIMARIPRELPHAETSGVCYAEESAGREFPFKSTADCLNQEALRMVRSLLLPAKAFERLPHGRSSL